MIKLLIKIKIIILKIFFLGRRSGKPKSKKRAAKSNMGSLYYLGSLLDNMKDYFALIRVLKKMHPDAYCLFRKIGGQVSNNDTLYDMGSLHKFWIDGRPAFGSLFLKGGDGEMWFYYYQKLDCPYYVERKTKEVYHIGILGADGPACKIHGGFGFHVSVADNGGVTVLKEVENQIVRLKSASFSRKIFDYPENFKYVYGHKETDRGGLTIEEWAGGLFRLVANKTANVQAGIRILVSKKNVSCAFNIDMLRTPYFFKDREKTVNQNGNTRKIFHIVRTHKRKEKFIKTHFRGLREFEWNGFDVEIKNPKSNLKLFNFDLSADILDDDDDKKKKYISSDRVGELLKKECA